jgi:hypothetical protein
MSSEDQALIRTCASDRWAEPGDGEGEASTRNEEQELDQEATEEGLHNDAEEYEAHQV